MQGSADGVHVIGRAGALTFAHAALVEGAQQHGADRTRFPAAQKLRHFLRDVEIDCPAVDRGIGDLLQGEVVAIAAGAECDGAARRRQRGGRLNQCGDTLSVVRVVDHCRDAAEFAEHEAAHVVARVSAEMSECFSGFRAESEFLRNS